MASITTPKGQAFCLVSQETKTPLSVYLPVVTTRDHARLLDWRDKLKGRAAATSLQQNVAVMLGLIKKAPELGELMNPDGTFNANHLAERITFLVRSGVDAEEAPEIAAREIGARIATMAAEDPEVARAIFFPDTKLACDRVTAELCMECIKAVAVPATEQDAQILAEPLDSDFWQTVAWEGALAFGEKFCSLLQ